MPLNIKETLEIFDEVDMEKYIEEYDKSMANVLSDMKNTNPIKKKKVPRKSEEIPEKSKSPKNSSWITYVRNVKRDMDSKRDTPVSFPEAASEASRRRNLSRNISNLNKSRREKIDRKRRSVRFSEEIKEIEPEIDLTEEPEVTEPLENIVPKQEEKIQEFVPVTVHVKSIPQTLQIHPDVKPIYTYRLISNQNIVVPCRYLYESYKNCLCVSILEYTQCYTKLLNFSWISTKNFQEDTYEKIFTDNVKLFINCWFHKYFIMVYDDLLKDKIVDLNVQFLNSLQICDLEYIVTFLNLMSKIQKYRFPIIDIIDMGYVAEKK